MAGCDLGPQTTQNRHINQHDVPATLLHDLNSPNGMVRGMRMRFLRLQHHERQVITDTREHFHNTPRDVLCVLDESAAHFEVPDAAESAEV
jgi:hypothetical protein